MSEIDTFIFYVICIVKHFVLISKFELQWKVLEKGMLESPFTFLPKILIGLIQVDSFLLEAQLFYEYTNTQGHTHKNSNTLIPNF